MGSALIGGDGFAREGKSRGYKGLHAPVRKSAGIHAPIDAAASRDWSALLLPSEGEGIAITTVQWIWRIRDLEIDYTVLNFVAPEKLYFRSKLEGHDLELIQGPKRFISSR